MRGAATPAVTPHRAATWVSQWNTIGGGVTLAPDGSLALWRVDPEGGLDSETRRLIAALEADLRSELDDVRGLREGVRAITRLKAHGMAYGVIQALGGGA